jgi:hypothetical protein
MPRPFDPPPRACVLELRQATIVAGVREDEAFADQTRVA